MQSLWTAASGLSSQQLRLDTIANNIANLNTDGYKSENVSFEDLLVSTYTQNGPTGAAQVRQGMNGVRVGTGVRAVSLPISFEAGALRQTNNPLDFAVDGHGFFAVKLPTGGTAYTRDGAFNVSTTANGTATLVTKQGYPVLDVNGLPIRLSGYDAATLHVEANGSITAIPANGGTATPGNVGQLQVASINNPEEALRPIGDNAYALVPGFKAGSQIAAAGQITGSVRQGFLEQSNVDLTQQMTNMMTAQRGLELDAKAVTTADSMMNMANNLRGGAP